MRVTSDWHMFPGTTIYRVCVFGYNNNKGFVQDTTILSWPWFATEEWMGHLKELAQVTTRHPNKFAKSGYYEENEFLESAGIPICPNYNKHACFTTRKEAEEYLARFIK